MLRAASVYIPAWLKFVITVERRERNFSKLDKTCKLLMTKKVVTVSSATMWQESVHIIEHIQSDFSDIISNE